jgi:hypothetical protein
VSEYTFTFRKAPEGIVEQGLSEEIYIYCFHIKYKSRQITLISTGKYIQSTHALISDLGMDVIPYNTRQIH